jgi:dolichol-phosphate mannosyltransferase
MESLSLIIPVSSAEELAKFDFSFYRRLLRERGQVSDVQIIVAGELGDAAQSGDIAQSGEGLGTTMLPLTGGGCVGALHAGLSAASNELLLVLDPRRSYAPEALISTLAGLRDSTVELAIAVPRRTETRGIFRSLGRRVLGLVGRATLGTSDVFSGLVALRRSRASRELMARQGRGSRLVLELLADTHGPHRDIPVETGLDDGLPIAPLRLDDLRQLKRLLDHRFGTFSRLVQFCMVGASGMVVDLTLYAILQAVFGRIWPLPSGAGTSSFSWPLATAGALSIFTALLWNFTLNRRLTFNDARGGSIVRQFLTYALGNALGIGVSLSLRLFLPMQFSFFNRHRLAAAVVGIIVATGISFSMSRWVVFIRRPSTGPAIAPTELPVNSALRESAAVS